jgi:hypothetical protein
MRAFLVLLVLAIVGIGAAGFFLGWYQFSTSPDEQKKNITLTVDPEKLAKDRDAVLGMVHSATSSKDQKSATPAADLKTIRDEFQQTAATRFKAMELNLVELKVKAKNGRAVTKEKMNQAIDELNKKTEDARKELRELEVAPQEQWDGLKNRLGASLDELEKGYEKTFSRFMNEPA